MKTLLSLILFLPFFVKSCSDTTSDEKDLSAQKWELVKMTGSMANSEKSGEEMEWQEYYLLNEDQTFEKYRERNNNTKQASGTYKYTTAGEEKYLVLTYTKGLDLIGNCTGDNKEQLLVQSDQSLSGTWNACDGPGLEYKKVN
ncbi:hypothetical protein [Abyssalbus ytuae]|uniref:Lipocalin-like domain-containing protein n=1 Tax=Abyssalbus ytuae TaxID=2926907 RepID=A0A9E7D054_9FLAO|nr:hypothetical protein [Abyssalbus ytuae]UOB18145.1 hypothetical protein MQE35_02320 [Abyssalbus ytuae]